ncbi:hypothetical protein RJT34_10798 [Clitoria ternatea]|uniref:Uncharacterized protein n=1 Tax=Clitoria ternatea TaxID=43366 RepID=A0AAN9JIU8_CLITE
MTQLVISYPNLEFIEPAFDNYEIQHLMVVDILLKPMANLSLLQPSDKICYPHSGSSSISALFDPVQWKYSPKQVKRSLKDSSKDQPREVQDSNYDTSDLEPDEGDHREENHHEDEDYSGSGYEGDFVDGYSGGQSDEQDKPVPPQYPSGYGLEAVDLWESLFEYCPCLARMKNIVVSK